MREIRSILIYGYGLMGRTVARTFAKTAFRTSIKTRQALNVTALPGDLVFLEQLPEIPPDLILEFVPEDKDTKLKVFAEIEAAYPNEEVMIATGTSGLDLVELSRGLKRPQTFLGLHYFMPADTTPVVEVMAGPKTERSLVDLLAEVMKKTGKEPIRIYKPIVGFLLNRLQHAVLHEAYYLIENGIATVAEIDLAAKRLLGPRMCITGLIQQKDISGLKVHADAQRTIVPTLYHNRVPNPMLQEMVFRGETGLQSGIGFYDWRNCDIELVRTQVSNQLESLSNLLEEYRAKHSGWNTRPVNRD